MERAKCSSCSREVPANRTNCLYCGTPLPEGCGEPQTPEPPPSTLAHHVLTCPICPSSTMERATLQGVTIQRCLDCKGMFLDGSTFDFMVQLVAEQAKRSGKRGKTREVKRSRPEMELRYIKCPACAQPMSRSSYAKCSGVIFDQCLKCGVWLDDQELQQILVFIKTGGLQMAERIAKEAKERQRLASLRTGDMKRIRGPYGGAFMGF